MAVSHEDFLKSAEILLNNEIKTEIGFRNIISRAYYAVFLLAREKSELLPVPENVNLDDAGSHEKVLFKFSKSTNEKLKSIGKMLFQQKENRRKADYDIHLNVMQSEAAQHFYDAKGLIKILENLQ